MSSNPSCGEERTIKIGDYLIKQTIGKGTFSKVKLGINRITNQKVAIKFLDKSKIIEKDDLERIIREMKIYKELSHQNVIKVYEMLDTNKYYMIIMEFYERGELFNYIVENGRLKEEETAYFFYQLINGIEYIHSKGIAHRDLKPENLLLDKEKKLKIIDFGLSNYFDGKNYLKTPCGSPCYASPEMISKNSYDGFKIDIWAIGIILFACLCGYLPFEDDDNDILFKKIVQCKLEYPNFLSHLSKDIMNKILVTDPMKRITIQQIKNHNFYLLGKKIYNERFHLDFDDIELERKSYTANPTYENITPTDNNHNIDYNELINIGYNPNNNKDSRNKKKTNLYNEYFVNGNSLNKSKGKKMNIYNSNKKDKMINFTINSNIQNIKKNKNYFNRINKSKGNSIQDEYKVELTEVSKRNVYNIKIKNNKNDLMKKPFQNFDKNKIILKPFNNNNPIFIPYFERRKYVSNPKNSNNLNIELNPYPNSNRRKILSEIKYTEELPHIRNENYLKILTNRTPIKTEINLNQPILNHNTKIKTNRLRELYNLNFNKNPIYFNPFRGNTSN